MEYSTFRIVPAPRRAHLLTPKRVALDLPICAKGGHDAIDGCPKLSCGSNRKAKMSKISFLSTVALDVQSIGTQRKSAHLGGNPARPREVRTEKLSKQSDSFFIVVKISKVIRPLVAVC